MLNLKQDAIANVCALLDIDRHIAVESCLPSLLVHILPLLAVSEFSPNGFSTADDSFLKRLPVAKRCYNAAVNELTEEVYTLFILDNLLLSHQQIHWTLNRFCKAFGPSYCSFVS